MKIENTYFGFTNNTKAMQGGRIEKTLDQLIRYDGKIVTQKEFIYLKLKDGFTPAFEENYCYYKRNGELSKPKTLYIIEKENLYNEINKTLYNYATYLLDNGFLDEVKATEFIDKEQRQIEEAKRIEEEEKERVRLENEHKREQQRKEHGERVKRNLDDGLQFIKERDLESTITQITRNHWQELQSFTSKNFEEFMTDVLNHFAKKFSHMEVVKDNIQYLIHEFPEYNTKRPENLFEEDVLKTIFNINDNDSKQTITAKVKAYYENREYKGGNSKSVEIDEFYCLHNAEGFKKVHGERWSYKGLEFFTYQNDNDFHVITELRSGASLTQATSKTAAITKAKELINTKRDAIERGIEATIRNKGLSPNVKDEVAV